MKTDDGLSWLESLACQFEQAALTIRAARSTIVAMEPIVASVTRSKQIDDCRAGIGEAIREVLAAKGPLGPTDILNAIDWSRVKSTARNRRGLVTMTLRKSDMFANVSKGLWDLDGRTR